MSSRKKLFITGAAGLVGSALRLHLRDRYDFRLLFHRTIPETEPGDEIMVSDVANFENMVEACEGVDAVIHLGIAIAGRGTPRTRYNQMIMETNIQGTYNVFEAARIHSVPKVIFASTNHVTGYYEKEGIVTGDDVMVRPDSMYGVSKAYGEALARHYHDAFGMSCYCLRIANFPNTDEVNSKYETGKNRWLSARDCSNLVTSCLEAPHPQFGIFNAVSRGAELKWDLSSSKRLVDWEPEDRGAPSP
ncbi:MAG: NAD(P)-dependent oxidoreductase [Gemmatimonadetes bacterium]|jgi:nucleoside-diphosphate-sugar epimerase|nr:NAD(P)-dependent oxidoreductase [Gemmatimonadota bacterium]MBT6144611.1 NAD(P)-dependent oxidoreductase [Gemmatimonadota bacterium]MBT7860445.1 NAD(P)-dependent oxidoreductase [Gemmatimonadota bacterium]